MKKQLAGELIRHSVTLLLCAVMLVVAPISYAWFASFWESGPAHLSLRTGKVEYPPVLMWTYLTEDEAPSASGWTACEISSDPDTGENTAPAIELTASGDEFIYSLPSLQIGTVDNVLTVKNDNIVYFRIEVDRSRFGDTVRLDFGPAEPTNTVGGITYAFELYNGQNLEDGHVKAVPAEGYGVMQSILDGTYGAKDPEEKEEKKVFSYASCIWSEKLTPADEGFSDLEFSEGGQATLVNPDTGADSYYVYLRIMPNLSTFLLMAKALAIYMPCLILCDEKIAVSFENRALSR